MGFLAVTTFEGMRPDYKAAGVAAFAASYFVPGFLDDLRGMLRHTPLTIVVIALSLATASGLIQYALESYGAIATSRVIGDLGIALVLAIFCVSVDERPPQIQSRKSKASEILHRLVKRIASVHRKPTPTQTEA